jgi:catechol 2,3-dioxygenase
MATEDVTTTIHPQTRIGHIHLTVSDLHRSIAFYRDLLGFAVTMWSGDSSVFLSAGGYHHHIGLNTWAGRGASPPPPGYTGLYHFAILYPNRHELAKVLKRLLDAHYPLLGTSDHGVSEAIYLADPDGNGIELYVDRPLETWPRDAEGRLKMSGRRALDVNTLLSVLDHEEC